MNPGRRPARLARRVLFSLALAAGLAAGLASCGGGTSQFEPFVPEQYVVFGDETSVIRADGRRHTVNPLNAAGAVDCAVEPIWTQAVANHFSFVFAECNPTGATEIKAQMRAVAGARIGDLEVQIDDQVARGGFAAKSLVTVLVGANDVIDVYGGYPTRTEEQLTAELRSRGEQLAAQVNRLVELGTRVIVSTVPDVGLSPFALQQKAANTDTDRAALISRLTSALNARLRVNILNDGRFVGLVLGDEAVQSMVRLSSAFGVADFERALCTVALPECSTQTLVSGGVATTWLWADDRHLAFIAQSRLGALAVARAVGNPF